MEEKFFTLKVSFEETSAWLTKLTQRFLFASAATKPEQSSVTATANLPKIPRSIKKKISSKTIRTGIDPMYLSYGPKSNADIYLPIKLPNLYVVTNRMNEPLLLTSRYAFPDEKPKRVLFVFLEKPDLVDFFYKAFHVINRGNITKAKYPLRCEKIPLSDFGSWLAKNSGQYQIVLTGPTIDSLPSADQIIDSITNICPKADVIFDFKKEDPFFFQQKNLGGPKILTPLEEIGLDPYFFDKLDVTPPFSKEIFNDLDSGRFYRRMLEVQKLYDKALKDGNSFHEYTYGSRSIIYKKILSRKLLFDAHKLKASSRVMTNSPPIPDLVGFYIFVDGHLSKIDPIFTRLEDLIEHMRKFPNRFSQSERKLEIKVDRLPGKKIEFLMKKNLVVL